MDIIDPKIERYLETLVTGKNPLLARLEDRAAREKFPIVGPLVGSLLALMSRSIGARRIMELGSGFGYSGIWFAETLPSDGTIIMTDFADSHREEALSNFRKAGIECHRDFLVGNALDLLSGVRGLLDIVFNDVDKEDYPLVVDPAYEKLRSGGLLITDNTLWYGKVVDKPADRTTEAIQLFNRKLADHEGFHTVHIPLRDGVSISIKR